MNRHVIPTVVAVSILCLMLAAPVAGQYSGYPYYYYQSGPPPPAYYYPQTAPAGTGNPYYYRLIPTPRGFMQWDRQIRLWDFQNLQRSPLNPESTLDYLLRTF